MEYQAAVKSSELNLYTKTQIDYRNMMGGRKKEGMGDLIAQYHLYKIKCPYSIVYLSSINNYLNKHIAGKLEEYVLNILTGAFRG